MDQDRLSGTAKNAAGKVEEGFGRAAGDAKAEFQGQIKQAEGAVQDLYGQAKDSVSSMEDTIRDYIENRPYTSAAIALGIGWLIGRSHRPL